MGSSLIKKLTASLLLVCLLLSSCSGSGKGGEESSENTPVKPSLPYKLQLWVTSSAEKQIANGDIPDGYSSSYELSMVKNEAESIQLSFYADDRVGGMTLSVSGDTEGLDIRFFEEETVTILGEKWPDALVPLKGEFFLPRKQTKTLLVNIATDSDTKAGKRSLIFTAKDGEGREAARFNVTVNVHNVDLDGAPAMKTFVLTYKNAIAKQHGYGEDLSKLNAAQMSEVNALYKKYYDLLLDYGISSADLPYSILDDRADAYMSDPRVTSFQIDPWVDDATLTAVYEKVKSNPVWLEKAVIYVMDEPYEAAHYVELEKRLERLKRLCPDVKKLVTFYNDLWYDSERDTVQYILDNSDIASPLFACFNQSFLYTENSIASIMKPLKDRIAEFKSEGKACWTYVGWQPGKPYNNLYVNEDGLDHRLLFWQMFDYGAEGFLYWASNYWLETGDPWRNMATVPWLDRNVYGDGSLLYNGNKVGIDGACASLRLDLIRDGIEDHELLSLAYNILGEKETNSIIDKVTRSITTYTGSCDIFFRARTDLIIAIENAENQE